MDALEQQRLMSAARALSHGGNAEGAIAKLKEVLKLSPSNPDALVFLAALELDCGRTGNAVKAIASALESAPNSGAAHRVHGHILLRQKKRKDAVAAFEESLRLDPFNWQNHLCLAMGLEAREHRERAEASYREALRLAPDEPDVLNAFGDFLTDLGRREEAKELIERAAAVASDDNDSLLVRAKMALHEDRVDEALDLTLWALRQDATNARALHLLSQIKMRRNPVLGIWWRWAVFTARMTPLMRWGFVIGLYVAWQILLRTTIVRLPAIIAVPLIVAWVGFCILTWVGPSILSRMVKRELRKVQIKPTF